jgi:hypothetical protein
MMENITPNYYKQGKTEVWDFIIEQNLGFLAGNVIKYICRYKEKNGIEDLEKAKAYIEKLIEVEVNNAKQNN